MCGDSRFLPDRYYIMEVARIDNPEVRWQLIHPEGAPGGICSRVRFCAHPRE
jgi:hypothetical protein